MAYEIDSSIYQEWLSKQRWDYFFTGTFRENYSYHGARRATMRFFQHYDRKPEFGAVFLESGHLYGKVHVHALLRYPDKALFHAASDLWFDWFNKFGRARVEVPRSQEDIAGYCSKYVTKHMNHETYFFIPNEN